jgi:hypothetical protein
LIRVILVFPALTYVFGRKIFFVFEILWNNRLIMEDKTIVEYRKHRQELIERTVGVICYLYRHGSQFRANRELCCQSGCVIAKLSCKSLLSEVFLFL